MQEIAKKGGGILNSALKIAEINEDLLYEKSLEKIKQSNTQGTGAIEIKKWIRS